MRNLSNILLEKLKINKDIRIPVHIPNEGDTVMIVNFLTGEHDCVLNIAHVTKIIGNTVTVSYSFDNDVNKETNTKLFIINTNYKETYFAKAKNKDLLFDKDTALNLLDNGIKNKERNIYPGCNVFYTDIVHYLTLKKKSLLEYGK